MPKDTFGIRLGNGSGTHWRKLLKRRPNENAHSPIKRKQKAGIVRSYGGGPFQSALVSSRAAAFGSRHAARMHIVGNHFEKNSPFSLKNC